MMTYNWKHKHEDVTWVLVLNLTINLFTLSLSDPRTTEAGLFCGNSTPPRNASYITNFVKGMEVIAQQVAANDWGRHVINSTTAPVFGLAQCYGDLSHTDCLFCYAVGRTRLPHCLPADSARLYLDGCFLRYDNYDFFNESVDPIRDAVNCIGSSGGEGAWEKKLGFNSSVDELIENVTRAAVVSNGGGGFFAVGEVEGVYGLAQCWKTLSSDGCRDCLVKAGKEVRKCLPSREGRGLNAGCYLRYSTENFYNDKAGDMQGTGYPATGVIVAIALAATAFLMFFSFASFACHVRMSRLKEERHNQRQISISFNKLSLNFKYETLEKATDYFNPSRKIGQGGAGCVFQGTLPNGETVAVKRLFFNTRQWVDEFFNEVNLISGIQHKNLVKLLGCSIEGPESILVYEYVPNKSLDHLLFEKDKVQSLTWKRRFAIIVGTAEGLAYLHGGSETRIIHRDIKSSNVLLDENLSPKIADFGLARCFAADKSHISTGIAGTLGYMAPEYLVKGQLTEKADVYSFGVLVLEIVCGRRNNAFVEDYRSLLQTVWQLYKANRLAECVDPRLGDGFPAKEASDVLQIGLLCTQASLSLRPSMAEVVHMLIHRGGEEIPPPNQPPFLNATVLNPANTVSIRSFNNNSSVSNLTRNEGSSSKSSSSGSLDKPSRRSGE